MNDIIKRAVNTALEYIQTGKEPEGWVPPRRRCSAEFRDITEAALAGYATDEGRKKLRRLLMEILGEEEDGPVPAVLPTAKALIRADDAMAFERAMARRKSVLAWTAYTVLKAVFDFAKEEKSALEKWATPFHREAVNTMALVERCPSAYEYTCRAIAAYAPWLLSLQREGVGGRKCLGVLGGSIPKNANYFPDWPMPTPHSPAWGAWDIAMERAAAMAGSILLECPESEGGECADDICTMVGIALIRAIDGPSCSPGSSIRWSLAMYRLWLLGKIPRKTFGNAHLLPDNLWHTGGRLSWLVDCIDEAIVEE